MMKLSLEESRYAMVRDQICARGVTSEDVIEAMQNVKRHLFVAPEDVDLAYGDFPVHIGFEQTISQPYMVASMTELLELKPFHKVLEIGTGSGYQTAVLCYMVDQVFTMERIPELAGMADFALNRAGFKNYKIITDDGSVGYPDEAPFNRIIVTAGSTSIPESLCQQLAEGGIMIIPVGEKNLQHLYKVQKKDGQLEKKRLYGCRFVKLIGKEGW